MTRITHNPRPDRTAALRADHRPWIALLASALLVAVGALLAATSAYGQDGYQNAEENGDAYGFVRRVEGEVLLAGLEQDDAVEAEINHPLLTGDRIEASSGRVELVLPDGSIVRVERGSTVVFDALAGSPDSEIDGGSVLVLEQGVLQVRTPDTFYGGDEFAIETPNADIYLGAAGTYRIKARGSSFTEVTVREGFAEAATNQGSTVAREGEALEVTGSSRPFAEVVAAGPADGLEYWAEDLDRAAPRRREEYVDSRLAYAAAPLYDSGEWLVVDAHRVWRPYVRTDWRPFQHGRWVYTPSGLTWVSSAPWGWVTSHYGSWDLVPGYGWLWYPGAYYQPASVYWYWGPTYVGWVPYGYYARHYGPRYGYGVHSWNVFGWAGGDWGFWADWTFCPTRYFGRPGYTRYWDTGRNLARTRRFAVPRGIVTSDTRGLSRDRWGKPNDVFETLIRRDPERAGRSLPDVTDFVARRKLSEARLSEIREDRTASIKERLRPLDRDNRGRFTSGTGSRSTDTTVRSGNGGSRSLSRDDSGERIGRSGTSRTFSDRSRSSDEDTGSSGRRIITRRSDGGDATSSDRGRDSRAGVRGGSTRDLGRYDKDEDENDGDRRLRLDRTEGGDRGSALRGDESAEDEAPARRVLDRIRAYRESQGSSSDSGSRRSSSATDDGSSESRSGSSARGSSSRSGSSRVTRESGSSSSKGSARGSSGSSSSSKGSVKRSSPPPQRSSASSGRSSGRSSGKGSARSSGGSSRSRVKRPNG